MYKYILIYLILINLISFTTMGIDKEKAINKKWRISELTFVILSLIGGAVGVILAIKVFKHKIKHKKFTIGIPLIFLIQIIIILYLFFK